MCKDWNRYWLGVAALAIGLVSTSASAHCDKLTGGGFIITTGNHTHPPAKGTFGVGGGCKHGQPWGHLEYHDHGNGLNVHWLTITGYGRISNDGAENDPKREGRRAICGTARTNLYGDVDFAVDVEDKGEPGVDDVFKMRLVKSGAIVYTTEFDHEHTLGGDTGPGGGNLQLHKPNPSTDEFASFFCAAVPGFTPF